MERLPFMALVLLAGSVFPIQALINARLGQSVGGPIWAAFFSFLVGTLALFAIAWLVAGPPRLGAVGALPPWIWSGGLIGALLVYAMAFSAPVLGAGVLLALIIGAQLVGSLTLDRFGILQEVRPIGPWQIAGAVLLITAVAMIVFGPRR